MVAQIEYKGIKKAYGDKVITEDFNLTVEKGDFVTIVGASGGGKTTVLKMINGLVEPTEGDILLEGESIKGKDLVKLRRSIGYVIQGNVLFPHMSVEDNVCYVLNLLKKSDKAQIKEAYNKWMKIVGLNPDLAKQLPGQLSGGQQQRVGIARALAASPNIIIMDEPFGAVDEITRSSLQIELKRIHNETGITIMFVTHDIQEALKLGTKVLVLSEGKIQQYDTPDEVVKNPANAYVKKLLRNLKRYIGFQEELEAASAK